MQSSFSEATIATNTERLVQDREVFVHGPIVAGAGWWERLRCRAAAAIDAEHAAHPERAGLELAALRANLALDDPELDEALVADLCRGGFSCVLGAIRRQYHQPSLPPSLAEAGKRICTALAARPFDPPSRKELIADAAAQKALRFLSETGAVIVINEEVLLSAEAFAQMKSRLTQTLRERGPSTVSELRQALGTTRRVLVPLLERCDSAGLTIRQGDLRTIRSP